MSVLIKNVDINEFAELLYRSDVRLNKNGDPIEFRELDLVKCKDCIYERVCDQSIEVYGKHYHLDYCNYGEPIDKLSAKHEEEQGKQ